MSVSWRTDATFPFLLGLQVVFIILFGGFVEYDPMAHSARAFDANATTIEGNNLGHYYPSKNY